MKISALTIALILFACSRTIAAPPDEGMWLPLLVSQNVEEMQRLGLKLTADQLYNANNSSLKDAIVHFGGFCTGEIISQDGLVLTNHHCGYGQIQSHSTVEHDYLTDGFWARTRSDELPNPGLFVAFLVRIENVTDKVQKEISADMPEAERLKKLYSEVFPAIEHQAAEQGRYRANVKEMYGGSEFYMYVYEDYKDVRLVGTPPESIGKFGGDTDNWMWPRHTGDFSIFRVYMSPDGKPAEYSENNVPYKPKHFLPISGKGIQENDFAMILGFPGRTQRYLTSWDVRKTFEQDNPARIKLRTRRLDLWKEDMDADTKTRIQYASKYARISNYWKYFIGQNKGLKRLNTIKKKEEEEAKFMKWVNEDASRRRKYGNVFTEIQQAVEDYREINLLNVYFAEAVGGSELMSYAAKFMKLYDKLDTEQAGEEIEKLQAGVDEYFKDYNAETDLKVSGALFRMYQEDVPRQQQHPFFAKIQKKYDGDYEEFFEDKVFPKSIFADKDKMIKFLSNPSKKKLAKDPGFSLYRDLFNHKNAITGEVTRSYQLTQSRYSRLYIDGLREMNKSKKFYPDANSTMRLTYGQVLDYVPMDAVQYSYYTTLKGIVEKEDPNNDEFRVPQRLIDLYKKKDFGEWAQDGDVRTCFIANTDITGGNSGSPVINGNGELIGLAFDGNWEAMTGDIVFDPELKRTICNDIRYVLFIIDKFAEARHLIKEMKIVR